ncbi:hypothetical protein CROQUDRAFT_663420 [Cronartium quercuum f. sp. fusiforme G11]|uniref:Uncharacterized protein n=1 Tax=Cronartium quercuum f. sp. fusiforme G11 TaxID=708437 RepID=A0A9P6N9F3_9BASI|nr:hypothetical protein CROQUDRAFT_663420 [Cronartium quercuum f. sp. fusiforme G11]
MHVPTFHQCLLITVISVSMFYLSLCSRIYSHPATLPPPTTRTIPHYPASYAFQIRSHPIAITRILPLPPLAI